MARNASFLDGWGLRAGKCTKTEGSIRAVPLQAIALEALERLPARADT